MRIIRHRLSPMADDPRLPPYSFSTIFAKNRCTLFGIMP
jgi:hypothetical protein